MALPVRSVQLFKVPAHDTVYFIGGGRRQLFTGRKEVCDFPEYPRVSLCSTANHQPAGAGVVQYLRRFPGRINIAVGENGDGNSTTDLSDGVVFSLAVAPVGTRSAMNRKSGNTGVFRQLGNVDSVARSGIRPGPDFQCDLNINRADDRIDDHANLFRIGQQR